jgi:hypothetical protein
MSASLSNVLNGPGVDQSRLEQSGFSPVQCGVFLDWARISLTFHQTGSDLLWTGLGLCCRVRFQVAGIGLIMG